jgi:hypothetical protein
MVDCWQPLYNPKTDEERELELAKEDFEYDATN